MCGILASIQRCSTVEEQFEDTWANLKDAISARGPDASALHTVLLPSSGEPQLQLQLFASELWLRGEIPVTQPYIEGDDVLCWNGEVFAGIDMSSSDNDGVQLFKRLRALDDPDRLVDVFATIEGPYAFAYYHGSSRRLYFGRDPLGRRSLLYQLPTLQHPRFLLASVSIGDSSSYALEEHSTLNFSCLELDKADVKGGVLLSSCYRRLARTPQSPNIHDRNYISPAKVCRSIPSEESMISCFDSSLPLELSDAVDGLLARLSESVRQQVYDIPSRGMDGKSRVAVLFSGGIDSTVVAYLASRHLPVDEPIDLLNVAFENPRKKKSKAELEADQSRIGKGRRRKGQSTVEVEADKEYGYLVPDRITGLEEVDELRRLCPERRWNFVEINVTYEESSKARALVESLMHPSRTVMDLSLALALYFASRGVGQVDVDGIKQPYVSPARVMLNGLGSDELLGGYGRHRSAYIAGGWDAVVNEIQEEIDRIPVRNLGRDDRVISANGKETRHPFLSLSVVNYLCELPVNIKMDPRLPLGLGDKMLLRLVARKEGLALASARKKRAMQFGTHSARMEGGEKDRRGDILL